MTTVAVLQPGYLPWLGFFDQMRRSDVFVYYDDVQFDKHGWRNRNRIKGPQGATWLTVPVLHAGRFGQTINDVGIDNRQPWAHKHVATLRQCYARAPYAQDYLPQIEELLSRPWRRLVELDIAAASLMQKWLGIERRVVRASTLGIPGRRSERLLAICRHFGATRYFSGSAAREYLDVALFEAHGVSVLWQDYAHPTYPQLYGEFVPYLSALDIILNTGPASSRILGGLS